MPNLNALNGKGKRMERTIVITYRWWRSDRKPIKAAHIETLEGRAWERIVESIGKGYFAGELTDSIHVTKRDPEDGLEYSGWWEKKEEHNPCT